MKEQRFCIECGDPLRGRADQKFCNDQCRSAYNNRQCSEHNVVIRNINRILKKNYAILSALIPEEKAIASKGELLRMGFDFEYHTSTYTTRNNRIYHFCYDRGFAVIENEKLILVKRGASSESCKE